MRIITLFFICLSVLWAPPAEGSSLYNVDHSPYSAHIAHKVGDIINVIVNEQPETQDSGTSNMQKKYDSFKFLLKKIFFPSFSLAEGFTETMGSGDEPGFDLNAESKYTANAQRNSQQKIAAYIPAQIIDIVDDGLFLIRGHKELNIQGRQTRMFVQGYVRQRDIGAGGDFDTGGAGLNTVLSTKLANAHIELEGQVVGRDLEPGIIEKVMGLLF